MRKIKPFGYRPSEAALTIIEEFMKEHNVKSKSQAVNDILEKFTPAMTKQTPETAEVTEGLIIECEMRPLVVRLFNGILTLHVPVHESVCKRCHKYPCINWQWAESWKRVHDWKQWMIKKEEFHQKQLAKMEAFQ